MTVETLIKILVRVAKQFVALSEQALENRLSEKDVGNREKPVKK